MKNRPTRERGFTLVEILVVITLLIIIASMVLFAINPAKVIEDSRISATKAGFNQIAKAAQIYTTQNESLPADTNRNIPVEFQPLLGSGTWPAGPWPGSVYDWDNWSDQTCWDGSTGIIQITMRQIPKYKSKTNYTLYFVIQGDGIPHCSDSSVKGECVNCISRYP